MKYLVISCRQCPSCNLFLPELRTIVECKWATCDLTCLCASKSCRSTSMYWVLALVYTCQPKVVVRKRANSSAICATSDVGLGLRIHIYTTQTVKTTPAYTHTHTRQSGRVCVCVSERERERERENWAGSYLRGPICGITDIFQVLMSVAQLNKIIAQGLKLWRHLLSRPSQGMHAKPRQPKHAHALVLWLPHCPCNLKCFKHAW